MTTKNNNMKAYEVQPGTKVRIIDKDPKVPPGAKQLDENDEVVILSLDGMHCNASDKEGNRVYMRAWTEVEIVETISS